MYETRAIYVIYLSTLTGEAKTVTRPLSRFLLPFTERGKADLFCFQHSVCRLLLINVVMRTAPTCRRIKLTILRKCHLLDFHENGLVQGYHVTRDFQSKIKTKQSISGGLIFRFCNFSLNVNRNNIVSFTSSFPSTVSLWAV